MLRGLPERRTAKCGIGRSESRAGGRNLIRDRARQIFLACLMGGKPHVKL